MYNLYYLSGISDWVLGVAELSYTVKGGISSITEFAYELRDACDEYLKRAMSLDDFRRIVFSYAKQYPEKFFYGENLNDTVSYRLGKKRVAVVNSILNNK